MGTKLVKSIKHTGSRGYLPNTVAGFDEVYNYETMNVFYNDGTSCQYNIGEIETFKQIKELCDDIRNNTNTTSDWRLIIETQGFLDFAKIKFLNITNKNEFKDIVWRQILFFNNRLHVMPQICISTELFKLCDGLYGQYAQFGCGWSNNYIVEISL